MQHDRYLGGSLAGQPPKRSIRSRAGRREIPSLWQIAGCLTFKGRFPHRLVRWSVWHPCGSSSCTRQAVYARAYTFGKIRFRSSKSGCGAGLARCGDVRSDTEPKCRQRPHPEAMLAIWKRSGRLVWGAEAVSLSSMAVRRHGHPFGRPFRCAGTAPWPIWRFGRRYDVRLRGNRVADRSASSAVRRDSIRRSCPGSSPCTGDGPARLLALE